MRTLVFFVLLALSSPALAQTPDEILAESVKKFKADSLPEADEDTTFTETVAPDFAKETKLAETKSVSSAFLAGKRKKARESLTIEAENPWPDSVEYFPSMRRKRR